MKKFVLHLNEVDKESLPYVGGKGANLGEMTKAGFPVPQGFCVTISAYQAHVDKSKEMDQFFTELDHVHADSLEEIRMLGKKIRKSIEHLSIPWEVQTAIVEAWQHHGMEKAYAVRSSATAEDLPGASFAGQQETYLNVRGLQQLLDAVRCCWASLFTDRSISYRAKNGFDHRQVFQSVVVQEMVFPDVSGIMFTADPITGNRKVTSIDASFGLGEALVSGLVSADLYQVKGGQIIQKKISDKKIAIYPVPDGGTKTKDLSLEKQQSQALSDEQILRLAELGQKIEEHYGTEQDIEWCFVNGELYIVQSRPITSLYPIPKITDNRLHAFISMGHQQMMTDAISPLGISILRTMFPLGKSGSARLESSAVLEAGGHLFFDPTALLYLKPVRRMLPRLLRLIDERIGSAIGQLVLLPEFQHPADKHVKKAFYRTARIAIRTVLPGLFVKDYAAARHDISLFMNKRIQETERLLFEVSGADRISKLQENLGNLILSVIRKIAPYMFSGLASKVLTEALVRRWLGNDERVHLLNKSLTGNVTSELGLMIGDLADIAREHPQVVEYLQRAEDHTFFDGLSQIQGGDTFGKEFEHFMSKYGMRCPGEIDIANSRWRESPTALVPSIISHIHSLAPGEHRDKFLQGEIEAQEAEKQIIADVRRTPWGRFKARILSRLIRNYRNLAGLREFPKYTLIRHFDIYKRAILNEAKELVKHGKLYRESEVFYLSLSELLAVKEGTLDGGIQKLIVHRKWQHQGNRKLIPPRVMTSEGEIITGVRRDVKAPDGALIGTPVSSGVVEGFAKVVLRAEEAKLHSGEIMIAPFTDPGWTPLFHSAKGLVMEVGGMMTHGAVVAREYGIPAVAGIDHATRILKDGSYIRIDGTHGYVQVLEEPNSPA
ncbi:phosphoenolpyruvate synthase [Paenibacillus sp. BSR1-1]|uniref:phosphoenolpyruvate synthase n=1 Tax=Paenibacillus sp. BSR1-1 TaxID=3020845 RepID=UPI0025B1EEE2|nr:phosphoenolpyruvate synthase [Paenibacillus sp. BSR1-1]MDN3017982.1 phosphoenolpyruvate synthase [Paenibacillus sp. BSR1-1]